MQAASTCTESPGQHPYDHDLQVCDSVFAYLRLKQSDSAFPFRQLLPGRNLSHV